MSASAIVMVVAAGLFAGAVANFAWARLPIWRRMPQSQFIGDFEQTIAIADKLQPAVLIVAIGATVVFAITSDGLTRILAFAAAAGFLAVLTASLAILVPLQRRIVSRRDPEPAIEEMRGRWYQGHLGRTALSVASFVVAVVAAVA